jgi:hypothetical protein
MEQSQVKQDAEHYPDPSILSLIAALREAERERNAAQASLDIAEGALREAEGALVLCGHTPLKPKGVFPTAQEIYDDRAERVAAAQEALTRIRAVMKGN